MTTHDLSEAIAITLNSARSVAGWTNLEALGNELGLAERTMQRYLTARDRPLPVDVLVRTCAVIGVPVSTIVADAERLLAQPPTPPRALNAG